MRHLSLLAIVALVPLFIRPSNGAASDYEPCKNQKALCFGLPENCISTDNCQVLYRSEFNQSTGFHFHLIGPTVPVDRYIAFGFSNQTGMSGLVVQCVHSAKRTELQFSFNGVNVVKGQHHNAAIDSTTKVTGFTNLKATYQDGQLTCEWTASPTAQILYDGIDFDIADIPFYFTLATGPYDPEKNQIHYHGNTTRIAASSATSFKSTSFIHPAETALVDYEPCKTQHALCLGLPENCISTGKCQVLYRSDFDQTAGFHMRLIGPSVADKRYIAFAFSNETGMSGLVVQCVHSAQRTELQFSFNGVNLPSGPQHHHNTPIANLTSVTGFTNLKAAYHDGVLICEWNASPTAQVHYDGITFDIAEGKSYFQLATGPYDPEKNVIHYHDKDRLSTATAISFKSTQILHASGSSMAVRWHGELAVPLIMLIMLLNVLY